MKKFHVTCALGLALCLAPLHTAAMAEDLKSDYFGRWVVDDPTQKFSSNGREYLMVDIGPCGADFCGVSVNQGNCGKTLFRFLNTSAQKTLLDGHGKWGEEKMKIQITNVDIDSKMIDRIFLGLGDDNYDITSREESINVFEYGYHRVSESECTAK